MDLRDFFNYLFYQVLILSVTFLGRFIHPIAGRVSVIIFFIHPIADFISAITFFIHPIDDLISEIISVEE